MKRGELPLTTEQLQIAFRHLRRPGSPQTLEEALAHPVFGPGLRGLARQFCREGKPTAASYRPPTPPGAPPGPPTQTEAPIRKQLRRGPRFDPRRAAANDFDD